MYTGYCEMCETRISRYVPYCKECGQDCGYFDLPEEVELPEEFILSLAKAVRDGGYRD